MTKASEEKNLKSKKSKTSDNKSNKTKSETKSRDSGASFEASFDEKRLFVTWDRFKPEPTDDLPEGLCKTVSFLLRHVAGIGFQWVEFSEILEKAKGLWTGLEKDLSEKVAYAICETRDAEENRPRLAFKTENGKKFIRALQQSERVTKPVHHADLDEPVKVYQGKDLIGWCDPAQINRVGRIWA